MTTSRPLASRSGFKYAAYQEAHHGSRERRIKGPAEEKAEMAKRTLDPDAAEETLLTRPASCHNAQTRRPAQARGADAARRRLGLLAWFCGGLRGSGADLGRCQLTCDALHSLTSLGWRLAPHSIGNGPADARPTFRNPLSQSRSKLPPLQSARRSPSSKPTPLRCARAPLHRGAEHTGDGAAVDCGLLRLNLHVASPAATPGTHKTRSSLPHGRDDERGHRGGHPHCGRSVAQ